MVSFSGQNIKSSIDLNSIETQTILIIQIICNISRDHPWKKFLRVFNRYESYSARFTNIVLSKIIVMIYDYHILLVKHLTFFPILFNESV